MHKKVKIKPMFFIVIFTLLLLCVGGLLLFLSSPVNSKDKKDIEMVWITKRHWRSIWLEH